LFVPEFGEYVLPRDWSKDGRHILASLIQPASNEMVLISVADGSVRTLKTIDSGMGSLDRRLPVTMSLSPDGQYVVYDLPPEKDYGNRDIFLLSVRTGREVHLVEHEANDLFPLWTPDGKYVVFASNRRGNFGLWILPVEDGEAQGWPQLVKADIGQHFVSLGFTSDGILYYRLSPGTRDAYLAGIDLSENRVVGEPTVISQRFLGFNSKPEWSVDGQFLSYVSRQHMLWHGGRRSYSRIVIRELDTGEERDISFPISFISRTSWSPDRRFFLVRGRALRYSYGVFKVDASTGDVTVVLKRDRKTRSWASQVSWSRDGRSMYYSLHEGYREKRQQSLRVRDLETGQETELLKSVWPYEFDGLGLSRDGQHLAYVWGNRDTGIRAIHIMPSLGGQPLEIFRVEKPEMLISPRSLEWTPGDREILFGRDVSSETEQEPFELMAISTQGGVPRSLGSLMEGVLDLALSPDGNQIAFTAGKIGSEVWAIDGFLPGD
jgi:Tol biopolymer transport system component